MTDNMKMKRNLIIFSAVLVLVVAAVILLPNLKPATPAPSPTSTQQDTSMLKLSDYKAEDVTEVTVANAKQTYTLYMQGDKYVIKGMEGIALDQGLVKSVLSNAASITGQTAIEQNPKDLSIYGLDKPQATVTAKYKDGKTNVFLLGNETSSGQSDYFMVQGGSWVVTVSPYVGSAFLNLKEWMMVKGTLPLTQDDVETVKMLKKGDVVMEITTLAPESKVSISPWTIIQPWKRSVDSQAFDAFLQAILKVQPGEVVDGDATDLAKYGLDKPEYDLILSGKGKSEELLIGKDRDETYTYVKIAGSNMVYVVDKSSLDFTSTSAYKLMDKMIILVNITNALGIEFNGLGQHGKMVIDQKPSVDDKGVAKKDGNGNPMYDQTFSINGNPIEDKVARYFYQTCIGLSTHSMVKEGWQPSGDPVATLTYTRTTEPSTITIDFMNYDKDFYAVRMNGGTYFLIKQSSVKKVANDLGQLIAGTLTVPK